MIIYGKKARAIHQEPISVSCEHCKNLNTVSIVVFQKYFHLFWIPFFPLRKATISVCSHCKQELSEKEFPTEYRIQADEIKRASKTPKWTFSLLFIFVIVFIWGKYESNQHLKEIDVLLKNPKVGQVYEIEDAANNYTIYKICKIENGMVYFAKSILSVNKLSELHKIKEMGESVFSDTIPHPLNGDFFKNEDNHILEIE